MLDAQAFERVVAVGEPDPLGTREDAVVDAAAAGGAALDLDRRERVAQAVQEGVGAAGPGGVRVRQDAVVVPFDVGDLMGGEDGGQLLEEVVAQVWQRHVQGHLVAAEGLVPGAERPVRVGAQEVAVGVGHLGLEPEAEIHAGGPDMGDQGVETLRPSARVDLPVAEGAGVVVAPGSRSAEPAIVEDEALGAQRGGAGGDVLEDREGVVEVDRLPAVVVHRAGGGGAGDDALADVALEGGGAAVEAIGGVGGMEGRRLE